MCILNIKQEVLNPDNFNVLSFVEHDSVHINVEHIDPEKTLHINKEFTKFDNYKLGIKVNSVLTQNDLRICKENGLHIECYVIDIKAKDLQHKDIKLKYYNIKEAEKAFNILKSSLFIYNNK